MPRDIEERKAICFRAARKIGNMLEQSGCRPFSRTKYPYLKDGNVVECCTDYYLIDESVDLVFKNKKLWVEICCGNEDQIEFIIQDRKNDMAFIFDEIYSIDELPNLNYSIMVAAVLAIEN